MELTNHSISELLNIYSSTVKELKSRGVLRTKNVVGEIGEYLILEYYERTPNLPNLSIVPLGTKNINAISQNGERYSIKSTTANVTGVFYGLQPQGSSEIDKQLFEYVVICKMNDDFELEGIYQLSWDNFQKHKKWHSRMNAWNITLSKAVKEDSIIIFEKNAQSETPCDEVNYDEDIVEESDDAQAITWNKTETVKHTKVREAVAERIRKTLGCNFQKSSQSRYVSSDKTQAIFVLSASYSEKNSEYWYSINDENIPWLKLFPTYHVAFALGGHENVLLLSCNQFEKLLDGCLRTKEEPEKNKKAHYHFSFAVEGNKVYFKRKKPNREFIDISDCLM